MFESTSQNVLCNIITVKNTLDYENGHLEKTCKQTLLKSIAIKSFLSKIKQCLWPLWLNQATLNPQILSVTVWRLLFAVLNDDSGCTGGKGRLSTINLHFKEAHSPKNSDFLLRWNLIEHRMERESRWTELRRLVLGSELYELQRSSEVPLQSVFLAQSHPQSLA